MAALTGTSTALALMKRPGPDWRLLWPLEGCHTLLWVWTVATCIFCCLLFAIYTAQPKMYVNVQATVTLS